MMSDIQDKLTVPLAIPVWQAMTILGSIIFGGGVIMNKLDTLVENGHKYEKKVDVLFERQVMNIANVTHLQTELNAIKSRLADLERSK